MKTYINNLGFPAAITASLFLLPTSRLMAQTLTTLHSFTEMNGNYNSDGANPRAGLILSGNTLYVTASQGGTSGGGTVFAVNTNGTGFTNLHSFNGFYDGASPFGRVVLLGNTLYGTVSYSGSSDYRTVFAVNTNGTGFTNLHSFTGDTDGRNPYAGLILSGNTLYGTAYRGGTLDNGSVSDSGTIFGLFIPPQLTIIRSAAVQQARTRRIRVVLRFGRLCNHANP